MRKGEEAPKPQLPNCINCGDVTRRHTTIRGKSVPFCGKCAAADQPEKK